MASTVKADENNADASRLYAAAEWQNPDRFLR
jgi:hypothetical protein